MNGDFLGKILVLTSGLLGLAYIFATAGMKYDDLEAEANKKNNKVALFSAIVAVMSLIVSIGTLVYTVNSMSEFDVRLLRIEREGAWPLMPQ
jgi:divalent metal cation (Fe/Co/Zn/Cd) transporter